MNKNLMKINKENKTIIVSKEFMMKAGQFGTPEFEMALSAKRDFPGYTLVIRTIKHNSEKWTYGDLTYKRMEEFIESHERNEDKRNTKLKEFEAMKVWARTQKAAYAKVKEWFLNEYKDEFKKADEGQKKND